MIYPKSTKHTYFCAFKNYWVALAALIFLSSAPAQERVSIDVIALFKDRAMLSINGSKAKIIRVGQTYKGVTMISSDTSQAIVEVAGERETLTLNSAVVLSKSLGTKPPPNSNPVVQVWENDQGFFRSNGTINGEDLEFLVDTGANLVVLSSVQADRIGLEYRSGQLGMATTASGNARMYLIELDEISFESISLSDIQAGVIIGNYPTVPLLGMSFLQQLDMNRSGSVMVLRKRF